MASCKLLLILGTRLQLIAGIFILLMASLVSAQPKSGQSSSMGLLFTTPEERAYLDYLREDFLERTASQGFDIQTEEIPQIDTPEPEQNVVFRLDAVITNQDGSHTLWLNGSPVREQDLPRNVNLVARSGQDMLQISTSSASYLLKPGQTVNLTSGELWESFEREQTINANTQEEAEVESEDSQPELVQSVETSPETLAPSTRPSASQTQAQAQGVVAIQDLIEALQMLQSSNNEAASDAAQQ
ncbi:MAG: hypothetical protein RL120_14920 [Gammaproteobacteria bacterium]